MLSFLCFLIGNNTKMSILIEQVATHLIISILKFPSKIYDYLSDFHIDSVPFLPAIFKRPSSVPNVDTAQLSLGAQTCQTGGAHL